MAITHPGMPRPFKPVTWLSNVWLGENRPRLSPRVAGKVPAGSLLLKDFNGSILRCGSGPRLAPTPRLASRLCAHESSAPSRPLPAPIALQSNSR